MEPPFHTPHALAPLRPGEAEAELHTPGMEVQKGEAQISGGLPTPFF